MPTTTCIPQDQAALAARARAVTGCPFDVDAELRELATALGLSTAALSLVDTDADNYALVVSAAVTLGGIPLRHFYAFQRNCSRRRVEFEGTIDDFLRAIRCVGGAPRAVCVHQPPATGALDVKATATRSLPHPLPHAAGGRMSAWSKLPGEIRNAVYDACMSPGVEVHTLEQSGVVVPAAALAVANHTFRSEYAARCHTNENKSQMPTIVFYSPTRQRPWSTLFADSDAQVCVELDAVYTWEAKRDLYRKMEQDIPGLHSRSITVVFFGVENCPSTFERHFFVPDHPRHLIRVIIKQELYLTNTNSPSGFALYSRTRQRRLIPGHCLRSNDLPGYLGLIFDFERPSQGEHVLQILGWRSSEAVKISVREQEALQRAIPEPGGSFASDLVFFPNPPTNTK